MLGHSHCDRSTVTLLTAQDRHLIDLARKLHGLDTADALRKESGEPDILAALTWFWGTARVALADVAGIAERLGSDDGSGDG